MTQDESAVRPAGKTEPHLREYLQVILQRRWAFIGIFLLVVLITLVVVLVQTPIYRPVCTLLLDPTRTRAMDIKEVYDPTFGAETGGRMLRREFLETHYRLITSRPIIEKTFYEAGFDKMSEFKDVKDPIEGFQKLFSVAGVRNTYLVNVSFDWKDPEVATRTLSLLVNQYIRTCRERALGISSDALDNLGAKAEELRPKLEAAAKKLQDFMATHNIVSLEKAENTILEQRKEISLSVTRAEIKRIEAESRYNNIRRALAEAQAPEDMPEVIDSPTVRDLKLEYVRTKLDCSDLGDRLGPNHPEVKAASATLKTITEKLAAEVRNVLAAAKAEFVRAKEQETALRAALTKQENAVRAFTKLADEYRIPKEAYARLSGDYRGVMGRIGEIEITLAAGPKEENVSIWSPPVVPTVPAKPRKKVALVLAALLGLGLGVGLCFFLDYLDTSIKTKEDVDALLGSSVLGYVPALRNGRERRHEKPAVAPDLIALNEPRSALAEAFRSIRTALSFTHTDGESHQFVVSSALPSEGKTIVSVNIAVALARAGKKVLLVDADLRRPRIHKIFKLGHSPGLTNTLAGEDTMSVDEVIRATGTENMSIITSGPLPPNASELLGGPRMTEVVKELGTRFDYVVYDTPPTISVTDAAVLGRQVHGAVMVVKSFVTDRRAAGNARELLDAAGARLLGVILNGVAAPRRGYRYYGYYRYYDYYYSEDKTGKNKKGKKRKARSKRHETQTS